MIPYLFLIEIAVPTIHIRRRAGEKHCAHLGRDLENPMWRISEYNQIKAGVYFILDVGSRKER